MIRRAAAILAAGAILLAVSASPASAGLLVTANDDSYAAVHDRVLSVAAPGLLANDSGVLPHARLTTRSRHGDRERQRQPPITQRRIRRLRRLHHEALC